MLRKYFLGPFALLGALASVSGAEQFSTCKFNFGVSWEKHVQVNCNYYRGNCAEVSELQMPANISFIASFIGWTQTGSTKLPPAPKADKEGAMIKDAIALDVTPVWYAYIIAEGAKTSGGLTDCNVGGGNGTLCEKGADYIRKNKSTILSQYGAYARFAAASTRWGKTKPFIWAIEPDFVQYMDGSQQGGGISNADAKALLSQIIDTIRVNMPNAWVSMDISPWKDQNQVIPAIVPLDKILFMNTSGGVSLPGSNIKDITSWATVWNLTKKGMIADDGYGVGGNPTSPNAGWSDVNNLKARIGDGVVALMEAVPGASWGNTVANLKSQLPNTKICNTIGVEPRSPVSGVLSARLAHGNLVLTVPEPGRARVRLVSLSGRTVADLGERFFGVEALSIPLEATLAGANLVMVQGDGWSATSPIFGSH